MDDGWNSSASGADAWSGSATTVDYGNNIGRCKFISILLILISVILNLFLISLSIDFL